MRIVKPSFETIERPPRERALHILCLAGGTCYHSAAEERDAEAQAAFVRRIVNSGHHSVLEHVSATVRLVVDRGVMAELTRHRLASFCLDESTRYCNYSDKDKFGGELTFVDHPSRDNGQYHAWKRFMQASESAYLDALMYGASPQEARSVLPNSLKTVIIMTANIREWMHIFSLRCAPAAHPDMRHIMCQVRDDFQAWLPEVFE